MNQSINKYQVFLSSRNCVLTRQCANANRRRQRLRNGNFKSWRTNGESDCVTKTKICHVLYCPIFFNIKFTFLFCKIMMLFLRNLMPIGVPGFPVVGLQHRGFGVVCPCIFRVLDVVLCRWGCASIQTSVRRACLIEYPHCSLACQRRGG